MYRFIAYVLLISLISQDINCETTPFNATTYALTHHCVWLSCNVSGYPSVYGGYSVQCCALQVPLNYANPDRTITISMTRLSPQQSTNVTNTLFMLSGGPGGSGWNLFYNALGSIPSSLGMTIILPDHRGTGLSTALTCDDNGSQTVDSACITYLLSKWGREGINQFSITSAAHDLSVQIQSYKIDKPGRITIFAVSYGTLWLDRFLQIYPTVVQASVMDGVFNPITRSNSRADLLTSGVTWQFLDYCQRQPACSNYFPAKESAAITLQKILNEVDLKTQICINIYFSHYRFTSNNLRNLFLDMVNDGTRYMDRTIVPAVIYRLNRCSLDDVTVLTYFFEYTATTAASTYPILLFSKALAYNIGQSEMWLALNETDIDEKTFNDWHTSTIMSLLYAPNYFALRSEWPLYPLDNYYGKFAAKAPVLMLSGQLDPTTVFEQASHLASITSKTRKFYAIPLAGHVTVNIGVVGFACPMNIVLAWSFPTLFPQAFSEPKCIQDLPTTIDFVGATEIGRQYSLKLLNISLPFGIQTSGASQSSPQTQAFRIFQTLQVLLCFTVSILFKTR
ncbi:unnamed protein product [Rotaria magnacalcarata]|uniref:AB hydrolase-1 domain-containing protein n=3 Tax=Rotaria magnacalcarata TaxID=392030 RepID=A0A815FTL3_9BILA|nr:unnamed protein product [Rotaria magnacalcarata]CAF1328550.1 unnamed protein product [Rotaria magnacalcarata]CAF3812883.1 unnamed protein product [Rotaria magnacalcarata]